MQTSSHHPARTLWMTGTLHGFTHAYNVALVPLYIQIQQDFKLAGLGQATFMVTLMMLSYCGPSYWAGVLADRFDRRRLLIAGLMINALAFVGLAFAPGYPAALACVVLAGLGGTLFHPAANALIGDVFPARTGRAMGYVGIGASAGFFVGPIYAGWRASQTGQWRTPVLELGLLGVACALFFAWTVRNAGPEPARARPATEPAHGPATPLFPSAGLWILFMAASAAFSLRDFSGASMSSLGSLFLQKAHGYTVRETGAALSGIFIASALSNPLFGRLSDRGRSRWGALVLLIAASLVALFPHMPAAWLVPTFLVYGFFQMASYPIVEAALMESTPNAVRGRVMGIWITVGGVVGNLAHWVVGQVVQSYGAAAAQPAAYYYLYALLGLLMLASLAGFPCLRAVGRREAATGALKLPAGPAALKLP